MGYYDSTVDSVEAVIEMYHRNRGKAMWKKNIRNEIYTILFGTVMALIIFFLAQADNGRGIL